MKLLVIGARRTCTNDALYVLEFPFLRHSPVSNFHFMLEGTQHMWKILDSQ